MAERGNAEAAFLLSYRWVLRYGAQAGKAQKLLKKAAALGHEEALYCLRSLCDEDAVREAAHPGDIIAQMQLGHNLACGDQGFTRDLTEARLWFARAAEAGHTGARFELGLMYLKGEGGPRNVGDGRRWLRLAAGDGHDTAIHVLELESGDEGIPNGPLP